MHPTAPTYQPDFFKIATKMTLMGGYVIPVPPGQKKCTLPEWQNRATKNLQQIEAWYNENHHYNCAIVGKLELGALWGFDDDGGGILTEYESVHGPIPTYRVRTVSGNTQLLFRHNQKSIEMGNLTLANEKGEELFSARTDNRYVISAGSVAHPHNDVSQPLTPYNAIDAREPIEAPDSFIQFLLVKVKASENSRNKKAAGVETGQVHEGGRNNYITSRLGAAHQTGVMMPELFTLGLQMNEQSCVPPLSESEVKTIAESINKYPVRDTTVLIGGVPAGTQPHVMSKPMPSATAAQFPDERPMETEAINEVESAINSLDYLPSTTLASTRLQDIYMDFNEHEWPLTLALPALVTAASVVVPVQPRLEGLIVGDDPMTNLYTALIAEVGAGKSQIAEWSAKAVGIWGNPMGSHYLEGKWGSAEQMIRSLHRKQDKFVNKSVLVNPDEWAHLFAKASIPDASFPTVLTTSYYRRNQVFTMSGKGGGRECMFNLAMSFIGGIVENEFDTVFGANSIGGLYDRFLFGRAPDNFKWDYRPYPFEEKKHWTDWNLKSVRVNGSVFEELKTWGRENPKMGRVSEICYRIAIIYASLDGRPEITGKDMEPLKDLALYQLGLRRAFRPNAGQSPDAVYANRALAWVNQHGEQWVSASKLKHALYRLEEKLGPYVAGRSLINLAKSGRIDLWLAGDADNPMPSDYKGPRVKIGLVRRVR